MVNEPSVFELSTVYNKIKPVLSKHLREKQKELLDPFKSSGLFYHNSLDQSYFL